MGQLDFNTKNKRRTRCQPLQYGVINTKTVLKCGLTQSFPNDAPNDLVWVTARADIQLVYTKTVRPFKILKYFHSKSLLP